MRLGSLATVLDVMLRKKERRERLLSFWVLRKGLREYKYTTHEASQVEEYFSLLVCFFSTFFIS